MCEQAGFEEVFVDRDKGRIPHGSNYRLEIEKSIRASDVILVLIGEKWQSLLDAKGEDSDDMVQIEIALGLEQGKLVVPFLLGGRIPALADLPERLKPFHYCNGSSFEPDTIDEQMPVVLRGLVEEAKRRRVEAEKKAAEEAQHRQEEEARHRAEEEARRKAEEEEAREMARRASALKSPSLEKLNPHHPQADGDSGAGGPKSEFLAVQSPNFLRSTGTSAAISVRVSQFAILRR